MMKPLFGNISSEFAARLLNCGNTQLFHADEHIFTEGEDATFLPVVLSGRVKMIHYLEVGREVIIGIFGKGEMFAVPPVFDGKSYPSTAIAMEPAELLLIERADFLDLLKDSSEFAFAVIGWMSEMLRDKTATIQNLATSSPEHRVGSVLLKLADAEHLPVKIALRREDIGQIAGLTTETTIRVVRRLADKGLLRIDHGKIFIDDPRQLRHFLAY